MLSISDGGSLTRALSLLNDPMKGLLNTRRDQLGDDFGEVARFFIVQPHDRTAWIEDALGFSLFQKLADGTRYGDPDYTSGFDWIIDHGFCWELAFEFTSDFTHVVFVENVPGVHRDLREFCAAYASEHAS